MFLVFVLQVLRLHALLEFSWRKVCEHALDHLSNKIERKTLSFHYQMINHTSILEHYSVFRVLFNFTHKDVIYRAINHI